ncbi:MAG TPA: glycosyltransferase family 39 protein [Anaerolineae bacterium]|nr:glycosyltransferase family 39 protein [Anaerolineae bacterium]
MQALDIKTIRKGGAYKLLLLLIILLYLFLSINFVLGYGGKAFKEPVGDSKYYEIMVKQLLQKGIYGYKSEVPNAYITPGYPLFLTLNYWIFGYANKPGGPYTEIRILQAIIGALTLFYIFLIGKRVSGNATGIVAALLLLLYPAFVKVPMYLLTETLATFFLIAYIYYQITALDGKSPWYSLISGMLIGLSVLTRPAGFVLLFVPFLYSYMIGSRERLLRLFIITLAGFTLVMMPWVVRNVVAIGSPAPFSTHSGDPLLAGVDPYYYKLGPEYKYHGPTYERVITEKLGDKFSYGLYAIKEGLKEKPLLYLKWFTIGKFSRLFGFPWVSAEGYLNVLQPIHHVIVVLGWIGIVIAIRARSIRMISLIIVVTTVTLLAFVPEPRYAFPLLPLLSINAAEVLVRSWRGGSSMDS